MDTLKNIQQLLAKELDGFENVFQASLKSKAPLLDVVMRYIVKQKGKQIRPMFVLLSAGICGQIDRRTYRGASLIELLHTATLVHDDVVDDAYQRRGFWSINALWKNKIAVLAGDYLLSRGLLLSVENEDFDLLKIVSHAVKVMSEGELLQIEKARRLDIDEEVYFEIITAKTASLIASACAVGSASANSNAEEIERMKKIGELVGIAFQLKDDLFDYGETKIGKPTHIDIKEKKMTLPLIYTLKKTDRMTRRRLINIVKNHNEDKKELNFLIKTVSETGGLDYAAHKMNEYYLQSISELEKFPDSKYKEALKDLIKFSIERNK